MAQIDISITGSTRELESAVNRANRLIQNLASTAEHSNARVANSASNTALKILADALPFGLSKTVAVTTNHLSALGESSTQVAGGIGQISAAISRIPVPVILGVAAAFSAINKAVDLATAAITRFAIPAMQTGLNYNDLIESSKYGMAGLIFQMTQLYEGQRKVTQETERWVASNEIAEHIQVQLQNAALKTKAIYSDLARGMQEGMGPMLQMGVQEDNITPFVTRAIQAMTTMRIPLREIGQEIRAFANLETNPRTARLSFAMISQAAVQMGVSAADAKKKLQELKDEGRLDEWFLANTKGMEIAAASSMKTLSGYWSNVKELMDRLLGEGTSQLYEQIKDQLDSLTKRVVTFDEAGKATFSPGLMGAIKATATVFELLLTVLDKIASVSLKVADNIAQIPNVPGNLLNLAKSIPSIGGISNPFFDPNNPWFKQEDIKKSKKYSFSLDTNQQLGNPNQYDEDPGKIFSEYAKYLGMSDTWLDKLKDSDREIKKAAEEQKKKWEDATKAVSEYLKKVTFDVRDSSLDQDILTGKMPSVQGEHIQAVRKINDSYEESKTKIKEWQDIVGNTASIKKANSELEKFRQTQLKIADFNRLNAWIEQGRTVGREIAASMPANVIDDLENFNNINAWIERGRAAGKEILKSMDEGANILRDTITRDVDKFARNFADPLANLLISAGHGGGEAFMQAASANFSDLVEKGGQHLADIIAASLGFGGKLTQDNNGNYLLNGQQISQEQWQKLKGKQDNLQKGLAFANIGLGSYSAGRSGQEGSITAGVIGGAMSGATMGAGWASVFTALAGAIVGGLSAAAGKAAAREDYKFGRVQFNQGTGQFGMTGTKNMSPGEIVEYNSRIQETFEKFWNGYTELAIKYGQEALLNLYNVPWLTSIQKEASKNFIKHLEEWIKNGLPDSTMNIFKPTLEKIYTGLGMTVQRFNEIFSNLNNLDPNKTLELLGLVAESLKNFANLSKYIPDIPMLGGGANFNLMIGQGFLAQNQPYTLMFADAQMRITQLASSVELLVGEQQIRAVHELSTALTDMFEEQKRLAQELANFLTNSARSFEQYRRSLNLEGMGNIVTDEEGNKTFKPDYAKQINYLQEYLQKVMNGIANAQNTEQLGFWQGEFFSTTQQMQQIYAQMGPEASAAFREWMLGANGNGGILKLFQDKIQERVFAWGNQLTNQTNELMKQVQPVIDTFKGILIQAGDAANGAGTGLGTLPTPIADVRKALEDLIPALEDFHNGLGGGSNAGTVGTESEATVNSSSYDTRVILRRTGAI